MTPESAEEYTQSLGQIAAGTWRQIAWAEKEGVPQALGMTIQEWVQERLGGYVRLSVEERHGAVRELEADGLSQRKIAGVLGVAPKTVRKDQAEDKSPPDADKTPTETANENGSGGKSSQERIAALPDDLADRVQGNGMLIDEAEAVVDERAAHVSSYIHKVRSALDLLIPMVGHPIPRDLSSALSKEELKALRAFLKATKEVLNV